MAETDVLSFCFSWRHRHCGKFFYIVITVWFGALIFIWMLSSRKNVRTHIKYAEQVTQMKYAKQVAKKELNVFENWHKLNQPNRQNEDKEESLFKLPTTSPDPTTKTMIRTIHPSKIEDIIKYYGNQNSSTQEKVNSILESLRFGPNPNIPSSLNCEAILQDDKKEIMNGKLANLELGSKIFTERKRKLKPTLDDVVKMAKNCEKFKQDRKYITIPLSKEEMAYPIAYIITIHRDLPSFERLLRSIYHPQNVYCVHMDQKSDDIFQEGVRTIAECFDNVFIPSELVNVRYTHWSRVQADLNCMEELVKKADQFPWNYVINLCGQDFPVKTNLEIVKSLKNLQGFNNLETFKTPTHKKRRYEFHFELPRDPKHDHSLMKRTEQKKLPPPYNIEMFAGSAYYIFKREAVEYMMKDHMIQEFFQWERDTYSPDENLWATLQRMYPQLPGSFPPHEKYDLNELQAITRIIKWGGLDTKVYPKCEGRFVRGICVFGVGDLAWLVSQRHLFANKFEPDIDILAIHCLEEWIRDKTVEQSKVYYARGYL